MRLAPGSLFFVTAAVVWMAEGAWAQQATPAEAECPQPYRLLRFDEDYSYLRDPSKKKEFFDDLKFIPLEESGDYFLTLGGEIRQRYELYHNFNWGKAPPDHNGYLLERYMAHFDLHAGNHIRVFGQLKSCLEYGRTGGPRPVDRDQVDLHQLFIDGVIDLGSTESLTLRLGRQEMAYGSTRIVSPREGPNVRLSFNGARAILKVNEWNVSGFATRPVETNPGAFDNEGDESKIFWGVYATGPTGLVPGMSVDLYYLGLERDVAPFDQGVAKEKRHSVGTRLWGKSGGLDYNFEALYQWGTWDGGDIRAWTVASDTGYTITELPLSPRIGLKADVASGDHNRNNPDLGTFNALFPRGGYFSDADYLGPANIIDVHPSLDFHLDQTVTAVIDMDFFWRQSTHDGIYNMAIVPIRPGNLSQERHIGNALNTFVTWQANRHIFLTVYYSHFFAGAFLEETPPGKDIDYFGVTLTLKF